MTFIEKLEHSWRKNNSLLCVRLDPDLEKIPVHLCDEEYPLFAFNRAIIDKTADLVCAYKPQVAYYSASGSEWDLELTVSHIHDNYPHVPVILDAKRGDIGSTAETLPTPRAGPPCRCATKSNTDSQDRGMP